MRFANTTPGLEVVVTGPRMTGAIGLIAYRLYRQKSVAVRIYSQSRGAYIDAVFEAKDVEPAGVIEKLATLSPKRRRP